MDTLTIGRLHTRFTPAVGAADHRRLRALPHRLLDGALTQAVDAAGLDTHALICVRRLHTDLRCDLSETDAAITDRWAVQLAEALSRSLAGGGPEGVVRYRSARAALLDLIFSVLEGDRRRAWAWRQVGLPTDGLAGQIMATALQRDPSAAPAVLAEAARRRRLEPLISAVAADDWISLAEAALHAVDLPPRWARFDGLIAVAPTEADGAPMPSDHPGQLTAAERALATPLGEGLAALGPTLDSARQTALRVLLALEAMPARLHAAGPSTLRALRRLMTAPPDARGRPARPTPGGAEATAAATRSALRGAADPRRSPDVAGPRLDPDAPSSRAASSAISAGEPQVAGWTEAGGLLFLLHLVGDHVEALLEGLPERPLRWTLHALARALCPLASDDPAALAFAGLPPGATPPDAPRLGRAPRPMEPAEQAIIDAVADDLRLTLAERLERSEDDPAAVLAEVSARQARIAADPGWFTVHLALDEVSVEVRRAGLDLDPDHVPWLGVVVRFVYA